VDHIAAEAARLAWETGAKVTVLPTIPFGVNTGQLDITLDINLYPSTQLAILRDITEVLARQGIPKLVVLNGHGGNDFRQILRELQAQFPSVFLCTVNWFKSGDRNKHFSAPGDHADEMETSVMMHLYPSLVRPLSEAGDGQAKEFKIKAFSQGWAWAQREWSQVTADTGTGDPSGSTPEKGEAYFREVTGRIGQFLTELAAADPKAMYE
jgi:creatinine amidohydrolase